MESAIPNATNIWKSREPPMLKHKHNSRNIHCSILLLFSIFILVTSVGSTDGSLYTTYYASDYNILNRTYLSGSVPSSVTSMDADYFSVRSEGTDTSVNTYNPSGYAFLGSTSWVSGSGSNLTSNDGVNMIFRSYLSGTDIEDYVDNNTSDVGSGTDKGTHGNFSAQQHGPDSIYDTLTEENTSVGGDWGITSSAFTSIADHSSYRYMGGTSPDVANIKVTKLHIRYSGTGTVAIALYTGGALTDPTGATKRTEAYNVAVSSGWNEIDVPDYDWEKNTVTWIGWCHDGGNVYFSSSSGDAGDFQSARGRWNQDAPSYADETSSMPTSPGSGSFNNYWYAMYVEYEKTYYEMDLEVQWTNADYDETNEYLCIYGGTMGSENIKVAAWNGIAWNNLLTDLSSGWNNVSVSSYLTSSNLTIRFKGSIETGDTTQDTWNIDAVLLHTWTDQSIAEVEFAGSSNTYSWKQLNWTIDSAWTIGSVNVTIQLYNYTLGNYPTSGNGYIVYTSSSTPNTDDTKYQIIMSNPQDFRNDTGGWKIKVKGVKSTDTEFDFKADLIEFKSTYDSASSQPFDWFTTLLYVLPVVFVFLFFLALKLKRRKSTKPHIEKKADAFSKSFRMTHQQIIGKKMLLEIDPKSDYQNALFNFASEARNSGETLFILTGINSALHSAVSGTENVKFLLTSPKTSHIQQINETETLLPAADLSVLLNAIVRIQKAHTDKTVNMLFDNLSNIILTCGFEKTYKFMRFLLETISSPKTTALFVFNPAAHDLTISSSIRGLFQIHLAYAKHESNVGTL